MDSQSKAIVNLTLELFAIFWSNGYQDERVSLPASHSPQVPTRGYTRAAASAIA